MTQSLISKMNLSFNQKFSKYSTVSICLRNNTTKTVSFWKMYTGFQEAGTVEICRDRQSDTEHPHQLVFIFTNFSAYICPAQTQQHKYSSPICSPVLTVWTLQDIFNTHSFSRGDAPSSRSVGVSASCWSSPISVYSLWHEVPYLSDGPVLLGLPASLSSSAGWCKC